MAISSSTGLPADNSSLANFIAWTGFVRAAFQAGWTQTSDTGQTNPTTLGATPAINTTVYEIYRMNDALQASNPVYVRLDYGTGTSANNPMLKLTVGSGSNGAGVVTGVTTLAFPSLTTSVGAVGATYPCKASYDGSRMTLVMWYTFGVNPSFFLNIERSHDSTGADTAEFVSILITNYGGAYGHYSNYITSNGIAQQRNHQEAVANFDAGTAINNSIAVFPTQHVIGYARYPQKGVLGGRANDWTLNDLPVIAIYPNDNHTYFCLKGFFTYLWPAVASPSANAVALMRFD